MSKVIEQINEKMIQKAEENIQDYEKVLREEYENKVMKFENQYVSMRAELKKFMATVRKNDKENPNKLELLILNKFNKEVLSQIEVRDGEGKKIVPPIEEVGDKTSVFDCMAQWIWIRENVLEGLMRIDKDDRENRKKREVIVNWYEMNENIIRKFAVEVGKNYEVMRVKNNQRGVYITAESDMVTNIMQMSFKKNRMWSDVTTGISYIQDHIKNLNEEIEKVENSVQVMHDKYVVTKIFFGYWEENILNKKFQKEGVYRKIEEEVAKEMKSKSKER